MGQERRHRAAAPTAHAPSAPGQNRPDRHGRPPDSCGPIGQRPVGCCLAFRFERTVDVPPSHASTADSKPSGASGGVQSLERAFDLLERMADAGGEVGLSELSASSGLPLPTIHRLMRTLVVCGYVRQQPNRRYALGPRLIRLGESASRLLGTWARPYLQRLVEETGETANMALLDGDEIVYVAQVPSKHSMRMFTEVGRRVLRTRPGWARRCSPTPRPTRSARCSPVPACLPRPRRRSPRPRASSTRWSRCAGRGTRWTTTSRRSGSAAWRSPSPTPHLGRHLHLGPAGRVTESATERIVPILQQVAGELSDALASNGAN